MEGGERRRLSLYGKRFSETLCRCCSAAPHLLPVSPADFPILLPLQSDQKRTCFALFCFSHLYFLIFYPFTFFLPLWSIQTWPSGCCLPSWCFLGIAGLMMKLNFTAVFKLIESSAWVTGSSGIIMYLIWVFKSAFAVRSGALDLGGSDG